MHILATTSSSLDDLIEPVDLNQPRSDVVALSFSASDLAGLERAWRQAGDLPSLSAANLSELRHPMSVDLWIEKTAEHARVILIRILGGAERWRYGVDQLAILARRRGIKLLLLPGECSERDEKLEAASTVDKPMLASVLSFFREGGRENMGRLAAGLAVLADRGEWPDIKAEPLPKAGFYRPDLGVAGQDEACAGFPAGASVLPILFYRSMLLAEDAAPVDALFQALSARGFAPLPIFVSGLKDGEAIRFLETVLPALQPAAIIAATAFASHTDDRGETLFDRLGVPVFQAVMATTRRVGWVENARGLNPSDLAMHVVLPELDGRILTGAISFKQARTDGGVSLVNVPEADRIEQVANRIAAFLRMKSAPPRDRRIVILMPDYPGAAPGRTGYAVGLDVPQSVLEMLRDLADAGYAVEEIPETARALLDRIESQEATVDLSTYRDFFAGLTETASSSVNATWGAAEQDDAFADGTFRFRVARFGQVFVALAPDRGRNEDRRVDYHDPAMPPRHALVAFGAWMQSVVAAHAIVHVGAHGTLEWLPGKTVALSRDCFPEIVTGPLPVVYPFIVSNPGEAAVAKRRIAAVTIGHVPPVLVNAGLSPQQLALEQLVDEYAQADGLDRRRRDRLAKLIVEKALETGLAAEAGVGAKDDADKALSRIDAFLCDLKDFAIKDGQHVFGRSPEGEADPLRLQSAKAEKAAVLAALDGRHIASGPSGAPARGRLDVLPTGRNLYAADPRTMPTPTAFELGRMAGEEVLRHHLQSHGDWPKHLVFDLWGSASLRNGGEDVAQALHLMGARPIHDPATGRVTGIEVLPPASLGRPRVDVTFRISGLFRDMFPALIALLDAAAKAVARRDEAPGDNPLAEEAAALGHIPARIFGSAPGTYGAGIEEKLASGAWDEREELGQAYLDAANHAFGGADGLEIFEDTGFTELVRRADLLVHTGDDPGRDLLDGSSDVAFIGGFSAAKAALGGIADIVALDTTDPARPRARSMTQALTRVVRARAVNPRFIAGQMRHGPRGAAEFAETVDRLVGFAETTHTVSSLLIEALYDAYFGNEEVRDFILRENPKAAEVMAARFLSARRRGLWHSRRNAVDAELEMLILPRSERIGA
ncbi:cobaltochelatase [Agrobacterium sp. ATCC 31749]|uniref:cobaltochelatase subunit CobN n=1 Tax=Agrobacterium TaxID=357 RepID=UPI00020DB372|nr:MULTISPECIES: cobaltochelatase subunit CobN [Agrobacterium]AYM58494.1 cobaltochelatase subunit [Agrobacterium fabrum]EGL66363.1 cobaltochelatase [Agrobacterium sp. ATCC 31749]NSZ12830.1 cobaltochelatase subunit CobN [Agrobacterium fabrum]QKW98037.1 cobaltochelatase subunit CobN [Agrobacterium sp. CGMCC 11546]